VGKEKIKRGNPGNRAVAYRADDEDNPEGLAADFRGARKQQGGRGHALWRHPRTEVGEHLLGLFENVDALRNLPRYT